MVHTITPCTTHPLRKQYANDMNSEQRIKCKRKERVLQKRFRIRTLDTASLRVSLVIPQDVKDSTTCAK